MPALCQKECEACRFEAALPVFDTNGARDGRNLLGTIMRRVEPHIYVANWFYLAFIVTIAVLHLGNNASAP
jgi:cbb3-type cytochrome oxidase subunit 1